MRFLVFFTSLVFSFTLYAQPDCIKNSKDRFTVKHLKINSEHQDFGCAFFKDKVVFATTNTNFSPIKRTWKVNKLPFLDLYYADISESRELVNIRRFPNKTNPKYNEGPATFNKAGDFMIFTTNRPEISKKDTLVRLEMYSSLFDGKTWSEPRALPFNNKNYSVGQGCLSPDGNTLWFVSDMPGGQGGTDIYVSEMDGNRWSEPKNAGATVNTPQNEMFPFVHPDGLLFFASNGHRGFGALDVFVMRINRGELSGTPKNLGNSLNSEADDFAFIIDAEQKYGYLSSDRKKGKGNDDIYGIEMHAPINVSVILAGTAKDPSGKLLPETDVSIYDSADKLVAKTKTGENGKFEAELLRNENYRIEGKKIDYESAQENLSTHEDKEEYFVDLVLEKKFTAEINVQIVDKKTGEAISDVKIIRTDEKMKTDSAFSNKSGKHIFVLGEKKQFDTIAYRFKFSKKSYVSRTYTFNEVVGTAAEFDIKIQMDKIEIGTDIGVLAKLKPIYFDFRESAIRRDAAQELDKIVEIMKENPTMEIELASHTDSRGNHAMNKILAGKRAASSANYIISKGIDESRIVSKGYGESKPRVVSEEVHKQYDFLPAGQVLNEDFVRTLPHDKAEKAHQLNRRTEFVVTKQ